MNLSAKTDDELNQMNNKPQERWAWRHFIGDAAAQH